MPKTNLWIINYCILEIKADNEPAISLPVYFKSVKKWKYVLRKKQQQQQQKKGTKKRNYNFLRRETNPGPPPCAVNTLSIAPRQLILKILVKLIIFNNTFAHEILPVDAVYSR